MKNKIIELSKLALSEVIKHRRHIHMNPETGFNEINTTKYIQNVLNEMGLTNHNIALKKSNTGVYVDIDSNKPGKTLLFRADIDALPMQELTNIEYKSKIDGVAHMCGHDGHTANLLGIAKVLLQMKNEFVGKVRLLFQPAEEGPDMGGAIEIVNEDIVMKNVDYAMGLHLYGGGEFDHVYFKKDEMYSSFIDWELTISSTGGHCSTPEKCADPIIIGAQAINLFQSIMTKSISPLQKAILAIGTFNSGSNSNVIPTEARLTGSIRTYDLEIGRKIISKMKSILNSLTELHNAKYKLDYLEGYPPLINNNVITEFLYNETKNILGNDRVHYIKNPSFGCEDFSYFSSMVPSCYFKIGLTKPNEKEILHHSGFFEWDDNVLLTSLITSVNAIISFLNNPKS